MLVIHLFLLHVQIGSLFGCSRATAAMSRLRLVSVAAACRLLIQLNTKASRVQYPNTSPGSHLAGVPVPAFVDHPCIFLVNRETS